jgi:hypothetical protein
VPSSKPILSHEKLLVVHYPKVLCLLCLGQGLIFVVSHVTEGEAAGVGKSKNLSLLDAYAYIIFVRLGLGHTL